ncbi:putative trans-sialidase, Group V [Trypanosoma cruzi]|uniref:Trans-sialidase, putative n=2 Tax=Trypanosoma cruzi TaxID=5693 RepID=Q4E199_TRYCC|nr:trans-sialidase, putative [Trypanosoma cruzi]EAN98542.1 trans-sialidase, putative [Trypanosoma cruzi]PWV17862.1 putative trans-sialidase, Group V [Trypanosoma cruzi]|eukprot:XP_820393.1 trans-sialidase [Trypanosoma cruzi strain CL Brener]
MMVPLTVDDGAYSFTHILLACFYSFLFTLLRRKKTSANRYCEIRRHQKDQQHTHRPHTHICMLSRVAAVMAPRTHNRRRVTGSSGRRREGRESEPERPNMSRRVFASAVLLLLVVMMCCGTGGAAATDNGTSSLRSLPKTYFFWRDKNEGETVSSLRVPVLVEMNGGVFAVAEAQLKDESGFTGIASELLEWTDKESKELDTTKLKTQVLEKFQVEQGEFPFLNVTQNASQNRTKVRVSRPTTVVNGSVIYMFAGTYSFEVTDKAADNAAAAAKWGLLVAVGNVSNDGSSGKKKIYWKDASVIPWTEFENQHKSLTGLIGGGGSGVQMKDGTFVFPMEGTKDGKVVSLIIYSSDNASGNLSKGMSADGCSDPSVVEWKGKLMMMTACDDGRRRVYESGDKGESWTEALGTLSRVWGNNQKRHEKGVGSGFSTATIENRDVMLVTLPVYSNRKGKEKRELHLWLTDNTHIVDIGPVSGDDDAAASSLLYKSAGGGNNTNERLIALYEKKGDGNSSLGMVSVRLTAQLKRVREVLATWKEVDGRVSKLCPSTAAKNPSTGSGCSAVKTTDGLVGFFSGNFSDNTWRDEYLGVNATVKKGTNGVATGYADGVTFHGAWAEWPVGAQGENQLYHFANHNFTLVATLSVHGEPKGDTPIPLMGATMNDNKKTVLLGLSHDKEGKWQLLCGGKTTKELRSNWEPETTHQVAIVLRNGTQGSAYVDGQRVGDASCELNNTDSKGISHFYIGGDGGSAGSKEDVPVTATNVLLYKRPLDDNEIRVLNANKISIPKLTDLKTVAAGATGVGAARHFGANGDGSAVCGGGLLPLLLLLGLWGIAAS